MRNLLVTGCIILLLAACTTERVMSDDDVKRAADLNAELGLGYIKQAQYQRAKEKLDKALKYNSEHANAHHYMAELYRRLNEPSKAEEYFKRAIELAPVNLTIQNNYAVFLCDAGRYDEAVTLFKKPLADPIYANRENIFENIGLCRLRQGRLQEAEAAFKDALAINAKLPKSLLQLAQIKYDTGQKLEAYKQFAQFTTLSPHTPESLWLGILLENERGAKNIVASYKVKLKGKFPDSPQTSLLLKMEREGKI